MVKPSHMATPSCQKHWERYSLMVVKIKVLITQSCLTLCDPMDCSLPGSSVPGILQAGILVWVAMPSPVDLPNPGIEPAPLALQVDSLPLSHQGTPAITF